MSAAYNGEEDTIRQLVMQTVTTYRPAGKNGSESKGETYEKQMAEVVKV